MKRIYLIGAALLLFLVIGSIEYNYRRNLASDTKDNAAAQTALPASSAISAVDNAPAAPVAEPATVTVPENNTRTTYARRHRHRVSNSKKASAGVALAAYVPDETATETSNDYYATTPVKKDGPVKKTVHVRYANDQVSSGRRHRIFPNNIGFGPEIGFNQNGLANSPASNIQTGSFHAGVIVNFGLSDHLAFQPGLRYINKGTKYMSEMDVNINEKLALHYLELPADLVYKFGKPNNTKVMIGAGPYISYLLNARDKFRSDDGDGTTDVIGAAQPNYNAANITKLDYGFSGFVGCETPEGLYAKVGTELGLQSIQKDGVPGNSARNYSFLFSVGYIMGGSYK